MLKCIATYIIVLKIESACQDGVTQINDRKLSAKFLLICCIFMSFHLLCFYFFCTKVGYFWDIENF